MRKSTRGNRRALTDAQVAAVLVWSEQRRTLLRRVRETTKTQLAEELGVGRASIDCIIARGPGYCPPAPANRLRGRPPIIGDAPTRARVHAWHAERVRLISLLKEIPTFAQCARALQVCQTVIYRIVATGGAYKQVSPEQRAQEIARRQHWFAVLRERGLL